jgi:signal transduction histidine kinase
MGLPWRAQVYLWLVVAGAGAFLAYWSRAWQWSEPFAVADGAVFVLLVALAAAAVNFPLEVLPKQKLNVAAAVYFAGLLLFGPPAAMALALLGQLLGGVTLAVRRYRDGRTRLRSLGGVVFNAAQACLATGLAGLVYYTLLPHQAPAPLEEAANLWALPGAAAALYLANTFAVAVMVGLQCGQNPATVWLDGRRTDALQFAALFPIGLVTALATVDHPWAPAAMVVPAAAVYLSTRRTVELRERTRAELEAQRRLARQQEELARHEAQEATLRELDRLKDELLATVAHELRTPLTVIHGYAEWLQLQTQAQGQARPRPSAAGAAGAAGAPGGAALERSATAIWKSSAHLARVVQDLADFGRAERGEVTVEPADFDLAPVLGELLSALRQDRAGERLTWRIPPRLPVRADRARVSQMVANLVENALKYAPEGPIVLRAGPAAGAAPAVRVEVEDRGPGVPPGEKARVWDKFYRGERVTAAGPVAGSGIGLAVVKALALAQGGRVGVESPAGGGARFWFELPAPGPLEAPGGPPAPARDRAAGAHPSG